MMRSFDLFLIGIVLCSLKAFEGVRAGVSCPAHLSHVKNSHRTVFRNTCYLFVDNELYWKKARDSCWALGGEMLSIKDQETMVFIKKKLNSKNLGWRRKGVWLGSRFQGGRWKWTDGSIMTYKNWASGQPSKVLSMFSVEDCSIMRKSDHWKWHDYICGSLKFHYNYICQFTTAVATSATVATSSSTIGTASAAVPKTKVKNVKADLKELNSELESVNWQSDESSSDQYHRLGENVYRLMEEKGMSSKSLVNLIMNKAMAKDPDAAKNGQEQVTSRVASSANQVKDNGNMTILVIVISLTAGFLLILFILFMLMRRHNQVVKAKAAERAVRYVNNTSNPRTAEAVVPPGLPSNMASDNSHYQPPPIPASRPPPLHDNTYLLPKEVTGMYAEVIRSNGITHTTNSKNPNCSCSYTNGLSKHGSPPSSSHHKSDPELGACGGSVQEADVMRPLMSSPATSNGSGLDNTSPPSLTPTEGCSCNVRSSQGEYIAMNSLASEDSCEKLNGEEKHTYSNIHTDLREYMAVENQYEALP